MGHFVQTMLAKEDNTSVHTNALLRSSVVKRLIVPFVADDANATQHEKQNDDGPVQ